MARRFEVTIHAAYDVTDEELRESYFIDPLEPNRGQLAAEVDAEGLAEDSLGSIEEHVKWVEVVVVEDGTIIGRAKRSR